MTDRNIIYRIFERETREPFVDIYSDGSVSIVSGKFDNEIKDDLVGIWEGLFACFDISGGSYNVATGALFNERYPKALLMLSIILDGDVDDKDYVVKYYGEGAKWTVKQEVL